MSTVPENRTQRPAAFSGTTAWARSAQTPLRAFLRTETGGAAILLAGTVAALMWANVDEASYERVWTTILSISLGSSSIVLDLRGWVNSGLMTIFFFVVGLEIRREIHRGELSELRRATLPLAAAVGGMLLPAVIYLTLNYGRGSVQGWGIPMATDIAFAVLSRERFAPGRRAVRAVSCRRRPRAWETARNPRALLAQ
jgi:Na+/H+ antiporter NhaA